MQVQWPYWCKPSARKSSHVTFYHTGQPPTYLNIHSQAQPTVLLTRSTYVPQPGLLAGWLPAGSPLHAPRTQAHTQVHTPGSFAHMLVKGLTAVLPYSTSPLGTKPVCESPGLAQQHTMQACHHGFSLNCNMPMKPKQVCKSPGPPCQLLAWVPRPYQGKKRPVIAQVKIVIY